MKTIGLNKWLAMPYQGNKKPITSSVISYGCDFELKNFNKTLKNNIKMKYVLKYKYLMMQICTNIS